MSLELSLFILTAVPMALILQSFAIFYWVFWAKKTFKIIQIIPTVNAFLDRNLTDAEIIQIRSDLAKGVENPHVRRNFTIEL